MNREQAKIYAKLSKEDLAILNEGYIKHYACMVAYANGASIEGDEFSYSYQPLTSPIFISDFDYRVVLPEIELLGVKVACNPPEKEPLPCGEVCYALDPIFVEGYIKRAWLNTPTDFLFLSRGMIFKRESDVIAVAKALGWFEECNH